MTVKAKNKKFAKALILKGISNLELSSMIPCSPSLISMVMHGWRQPTKDMANKIEEILECGHLFDEFSENPDDDLISEPKKYLEKCDIFTYAEQQYPLTGNQEEDSRYTWPNRWRIAKHESSVYAIALREMKESIGSVADLIAPEERSLFGTPENE